MTTKQGHKNLKFTKKSGETSQHKDPVPGWDYNLLNDCDKDDNENEQDDADGKELSRRDEQDRDLVEDIKEDENDEEHKRFFNDNDPEDLEGANEEPKEDNTEQAIHYLTEALHDDTLLEGEQLSEEVADDNNDKTRNYWDVTEPTRNCREPEQLKCIQALMLSSANQTIASGTLRLGHMTFQKVIKEQEHNLFD